VAVGLGGQQGDDGPHQGSNATIRPANQLKKNLFTKMCKSSKAGFYLGS